jgi:FkbM family methyltransferase
MLASHLRRVAQKTRHAPGLRSLTPLWNWIRPVYERVLNALSTGRGVEVQIAGCPIRLSPRFAGTAWESVEQKSYESFANAVRAGDVVYDVGAHIGTYTVVALQKSGPSGRVVAYEPVDLTRVFLKRHLQWNSGGDRVVVRPVSCGSQSGQASLYLREGEMNGDSGLVPVRGARSVVVPVRTLDSEVEELGLVPTIVKIDVEGWEFEVLKGAEYILARYRPLLFLSLHPEALAQLHTSADGVQTWLEERGYHSRVIGEDHEIHVVAQAGTPTARQNLCQTSIAGRAV